MRKALSPRALLGTSAAVLQLQADTKLAEQTDSQVLITGEPGVGKRDLALLIHSRSVRRNNAFESVSDGDPSDTQLHQVLHAARKGTLYINRIDAIGPEMQERLSQLLEREEALSDGRDEEWDAYDVRIIVGAPPALFDQVASKQFREELYYKINVIHLVVPPLRERIDDLPAHLSDVLKAFAQESGTAAPEVLPETLAQLSAYSWPGNDRELESLARLLVRRGSRTIGPDDLPPELTKP